MGRNCIYEDKSQIKGVMYEENLSKKDIKRLKELVNGILINDGMDDYKIQDMCICDDILDDYDL